MKKRVALYVLLTICGLLAFSAAHEAATAHRGYDAIGGEVVLILLPVLWWIGKTTIKDVARIFKELKNGGNKHADSFNND